MTTQHVPHTPLWRKVLLSLPQTRLGWWALGLASIALILAAIGPESALSLPWVGEALAIFLFITMLGSALAGGVVGLTAVGHLDRSLLVWVAQVPALLLFTLLFGFGREGSPWVPFLISVSFWAVMNFSIIWSTRKSGES